MIFSMDEVYCSFVRYKSSWNFTRLFQIKGHTTFCVYLLGNIWIYRSILRWLGNTGELKSSGKYHNRHNEQNSTVIARPETIISLESSMLSKCSPKWCQYNPFCDFRRTLYLLHIWNIHLMKTVLFWIILQYRRRICEVKLKIHATSSIDMPNIRLNSSAAPITVKMTQRNTWTDGQMRGEWRAVVQCLGAGAAVCSRSEKKTIYCPGQ